MALTCCNRGGSKVWLCLKAWKKGEFLNAVIWWPFHLLPQCYIWKYKRASMDNLKRVSKSLQMKIELRCQRFHYKESCGSSWNQTLLRVLLKWMKNALLKFAKAANSCEHWKPLFVSYHRIKHFMDGVGEHFLIRSIPQVLRGGKCWFWCIAWMSVASPESWWWEGSWDQARVSNATGVSCSISLENPWAFLLLIIWFLYEQSSISNRHVV